MLWQIPNFLIYFQFDCVNMLKSRDDTHKTGHSFEILSNQKRNFMQICQPQLAWSYSRFYWLFFLCLCAIVIDARTHSVIVSFIVSLMQFAIRRCKCEHINIQHLLGFCSTWIEWHFVYERVCVCVTASNLQWLAADLVHTNAAH